MITRRGYRFRLLLIVLLIMIAPFLVPQQVFAVCSSEERIEMAMDGVPNHKINRICNQRGPITGSVCSTLEGKCRLERPQEFFSPCVCIDSYGQRHPGEVQQY